MIENTLKKNLKLSFLETDTLYYKQFANNYILNLSIIDAIMFKSVEQIQSILRKYSLV